MTEPITLQLPDIDLPDPAPKPPVIPKGDPFAIPDGPVSHDQLFWGMFALKASIDELLARVIGVEEKQKEDSRALEKAAEKWDAIGHAVSAISTIQRNLADEEMAAHERQLHPEGPPTIPVPPPELDADERTTPGYRVPAYGGDPGDE